MAATGTRRLLILPAALIAAGAAMAGGTPPASGATAANQAPAAIADPTSLVDPFVGTAAGGDTFPGAATPFGMTQPSPITPSRTSGGDYSYTDSEIRGFSAVHVSGPGCPALGHLSLMPVTGTVASTAAAGYASEFSHGTEAAHPGYYAVTLASYGIRAELTATERTAWERFTFPANHSGYATGPGTVLLNLGDAQDPTTGAELAVTGPDTVSGFQSTQVFCNAGYRPVTVYFTARFSAPFASTGTWNHGPVRWGSRTVRGTAAGGAFRFRGDPRQVTASIGVSYVSAGNAARNLAAETPRPGTSSRGFDAVENQAHATWRQWLDKAAVYGGTHADRVSYYTALYHALIEPNVFSDVSGQYFGMDGKIHTATGRTEYTNLSLWDTYRTQQELLDLIAPGVARDVVLSIMSDTRELGWVPRWVLANEETNTMSGDSVTEFFADALAAHLVTPAEVATVYPYLKDNATQAPPAGSEAEGRTGIADYRKNGYVPFTLGGAYEQRAAASATLEYALADCSLSHVAAELGHRADAADFATTAHDYQTEFDPQTGFFRPRYADGSWLTPFDPAFVSLPYIATDARGYDEGSAWQYLWLAPQDTDGGATSLASLLGGSGRAVTDLNQFFAFGQVAADPGAAVTAWNSGALYDPGNEVDLQAPYAYDALGAPWRTQAVVAAARSVYRPVPAGIPGNDDLGEMSAWYVMSALGLYPYAAGQGVYTLTTPLFPVAVLRLPRPAGSPAGRGGPLVISAGGNGKYVHGLTVDGQAHPAAWITIAQLAGSHDLAYRTGPAPDAGWAADPGGAPPAFCAG